MDVRREREVMRPPIVAVTVALLAIITGVAMVVIGWRQPTQVRASIVQVEPAPR